MKEFINSQSVILDTLNLIKRLIFIFDTIAQFAYVGYLVFRLCTGSGILIANIVLVAISAVYLLFHLISKREFYTVEQQKNRKKVKNVVRISKRLTNLVVIVFAVIQLCQATATDNIGTLLTLLMILCYLLSILFDVLNAFIDTRVAMITNAARIDVYELKEQHPKIIGFAQLIGLRFPDKQPEVEDNMLVRIQGARNRCESKSKRKADLLNKN